MTERLNVLLDRALQYEALGWSIVPIRPGTKWTYGKWKKYQTRRATKEEITQWWKKHPRANIGLVTGKISDVIVFDIDSEKASKFIKEQGGVPKTPQSRTGRENGQHFFLKHPNYLVKNDENKEIGLDIRGKGGLAVLPPSIHKNGNEYVWKRWFEPWEGCEPAEMHPWMHDYIKSRNLVIKPQSKNNKPATKAGNNNYDPEADFEQVKEKCSFIKHCVDDAPSLSESEWYAMISISSRCKNGEQISHDISKPYPGYKNGETTKKIIHGLNDTGPYTCAYISNHLGKKYCPTCEHYGKVTSPIVLGNGLPDEIYKEEIEKLNEEYAVVNLKGDCAVMREVHDPTTDRPDVEFSKVSSFHHLLGNREGDWSLFHDHIYKVISNSNSLACDYIMAWLAHLFQNPGSERPGTAIVLRGGQGVGKGVFAVNIGHILGQHFLQVTDPYHLTGRFNSHLKDRLLVYCDEAVWGGNRTAEGKLKALITEEYNLIEPKGVNPFSVKNHARFIIASNADWVVPAGIDERRMFVLDVNPKYQREHEYFNKLIQQMENGGREAMLYDLLEYDYSTINLKEFPRTEALLDQITRSMTPVQKFWYAKLKEGLLLKEHTFWEGWVATQELHDEFIEYSKTIGDRYRPDANQFIKDLKRECPYIRRTRPRNSDTSIYRSYGYEFPILDECRGMFEDRINMRIDWEETEE
jgi:hypothetical protein